MDWYGRFAGRVRGSSSSSDESSVRSMTSAAFRFDALDGGATSALGPGRAGGASSSERLMSSTSTTLPTLGRGSATGRIS